MNSFQLLHPAIQHHIINSLGWRELRPFQEAAISHILEGKHAVVLAPTAGGKTEAVVFPALSRMLTESWAGLSVLYICPIKALLNNLEPRLCRYMSLIGRRCEIWHGDVPAGRRRQMIKAPPDLLLTTPESIEVILTSSAIDGRGFLKGTQMVIIDEVHSFAGDDRGCHLLSLLSRLLRICGKEFQRVALSATVGNPELLMEWLTGGCSGDKVVLLPPGDTPKCNADIKLDFVGSLENAAHVISRLFRSEKRLVFIDSRGRAERLGHELRKYGVKTFVTHSSLSRSQRTDAEEAFQSEEDCVVVATSVLELGVDVGDLDKVIQIDAPFTVSGFLQRMGRTGRRAGTIRNCLFLATDEQALLRAAGLVDLFSTGYIESVQPPDDVFNILAQQLMALILQEKGIGRNAWFEWIANVRIFETMKRRDVAKMVDWMIERSILTEDQGILFFGREGEEKYGRKNFLELMSVFLAPPIFTVLHGNEEVGYVDERLFLGESSAEKSILLAGQSWMVTHIDWKCRRVYVRPSDGEGRVSWLGTSPGTNFQLCQAIKSVLAGCSVSESWSRRATDRVANARLQVPWLDDVDATYVVNDSKGNNWWTFAGTRANATLSAWLQEVLGVKVRHDDLVVSYPGDIAYSAFYRSFERLGEKKSYEYDVPVNENALQGLKFSEIIPQELAMLSVRNRLKDYDAVKAVLHADAHSVILE